MLGRRKNLKQYILYLNIAIDSRLIEHLAPFIGQKRGNEEIRRLIYAGLDCETRATLPETSRRAFTLPEESAPMSSDAPQPERRNLISDVRQKAKKMFG